MKSIVYMDPDLVQLPRLYCDFFSYYSQKKCEYCPEVTKESSVCLICGFHVHIDCLDSRKEHSKNCTTANGLLLDINTTYTNILRDDYYGTWHYSLYLDEHGEQDLYLKYLKLIIDFIFCFYKVYFYLQTWKATILK